MREKMNRFTSNNTRVIFGQFYTYHLMHFISEHLFVKIVFPLEVAKVFNFLYGCSLLL